MKQLLLTLAILPLFICGKLAAQSPLCLQILANAAPSSYQNISDFISLPNGNNLMLMNEGLTFHLTEIDNAGNAVSSYGFANNDKASNTGKVIVLSNGNYGVILNSISVAYGMPFLTVFEISPSGNIVSEKSLHSLASSPISSSIYETMKMKKDNAGNYYVTGSYFQENFIYKFDPNLVLQWRLESYRDTTGNTKLPGFDIEFCDDSSFYFSEKDQDSLVISRIGTNGTIYFTKKITDGQYRRARDIVKAADGSLYIGGLTYGSNPTFYTGLLMKYDANLNLVFEKQYSCTYNNDTNGMPFKEIQIVGNEIHLTGTLEGPNSNQYFLMQTDLNGNAISSWVAPGTCSVINHQQEPFSLFQMNGQEVFNYYTDYNCSASVWTPQKNAYLYRGTTLDPSAWCDWHPLSVNVFDNSDSVGNLTTGFAPYTLLTYPVMQTTTNYSSDTASVSVNVACNSVGINFVKDNSSIKIFPNPSDGQIKIDGLNFTNAIINVVDMSGKLILSEKMSSPATIIDLGKIEKGIYIVQIAHEGKTLKREKLIVY